MLNFFISTLPFLMALAKYCCVANRFLSIRVLTCSLVSQSLLGAPLVSGAPRAASQSEGLEAGWDVPAAVGLSGFLDCEGAVFVNEAEVESVFMAK